MAEPIPFCNVAWGDEFFAKQHWQTNWTGATEAARLAHLNNSTKVIQTFCTFFGEPPEPDAEPPVIKYNPTSDDDPAIPDWLREACCYEALYFFDLENDPSRPFPLGILGIIKDGTTVFDHDYEPPLFSAMARRILENNGALVDDPYDQTRGAPKKFLQ